MSTAKFPLGKTVITRNALGTLHPLDIPSCLLRHVTGDWGKLCDEDKAVNEHALAEGGRLLSRYEDRNHVAFYIITEADRSITTVLLPEDY